MPVYAVANDVVRTINEGIGIVRAMVSDADGPYSIPNPVIGRTIRFRVLARWACCSFSMTPTQPDTEPRRRLGRPWSPRLGVDAIDQYQTLTNTYSAEYGGVGGAINPLLNQSLQHLPQLGL